jgi:hypothetical protein
MDTSSQIDLELTLPVYKRLRDAKDNNECWQALSWTGYIVLGLYITLAFLFPASLLVSTWFAFAAIIFFSLMQWKQMSVSYELFRAEYENRQWNVALNKTSKNQENSQMNVLRYYLNIVFTICPLLVSAIFGFFYSLKFLPMIAGTTWEPFVFLAPYAPWIIGGCLILVACGLLISIISSLFDLHNHRINYEELRGNITKKFITLGFILALSMCLCVSLGIVSSMAIGFGLAGGFLGLSILFAIIAYASHKKKSLANSNTQSTTSSLVSTSSSTTETSKKSAALEPILPPSPPVAKKKTTSLNTQQPIIMRMEKERRNIAIEAEKRDDFFGQIGFILFCVVLILQTLITASILSATFPLNLFLLIASMIFFVTEFNKIWSTINSLRTRYHINLPNKNKFQAMQWSEYYYEFSCRIFSSMSFCLIALAYGCSALSALDISFAFLTTFSSIIVPITPVLFASIYTLPLFIDGYSTRVRKTEGIQNPNDKSDNISTCRTIIWFLLTIGFSIAQTYMPLYLACLGATIIVSIVIIGFRLWEYFHPYKKSTATAANTTNTEQQNITNTVIVTNKTNTEQQNTHLPSPWLLSPYDKPFSFNNQPNQDVLLYKETTNFKKAKNNANFWQRFSYFSYIVFGIYILLDVIFPASAILNPWVAFGAITFFAVIQWINMCSSYIQLRTEFENKELTEKHKMGTFQYYSRMLFTVNPLLLSAILGVFYALKFLPMLVGTTWESFTALAPFAPWIIGGCLISIGIGALFSIFYSCIDYNNNLIKEDERNKNILNNIAKLGILLAIIMCLCVSLGIITSFAIGFGLAGGFVGIAIIVLIFNTSVKKCGPDLKKNSAKTVKYTDAELQKESRLRAIQAEKRDDLFGQVGFIFFCASLIIYTLINNPYFQPYLPLAFTNAIPILNYFSLAANVIFFITEFQKMWSAINALHTRYRIELPENEKGKHTKMGVAEYYYEFLYRVLSSLGLCLFALAYAGNALSFLLNINIPFITTFSSTLIPFTNILFAAIYALPLLLEAYAARVRQTEGVYFSNDKSRDQAICKTVTYLVLTIGFIFLKAFAPAYLFCLCASIIVSMVIIGFKIWEYCKAPNSKDNSVTPVSDIIEMDVEDKSPQPLKILELQQKSESTNSDSSAPKAVVAKSPSSTSTTSSAPTPQIIKDSAATQDDEDVSPKSDLATTNNSSVTKSSPPLKNNEDPPANQQKLRYIWRFFPGSYCNLTSNDIQKQTSTTAPLIPTREHYKLTNTNKS